MSSTQGNLVLVLMGATAAAPWAALALESRTVREKRARRKARRTLRTAGFRAVSAGTAARDAAIVPAFPLNWDSTITPGSTSASAPRIATVTPIVAPADEVFVSVGAVIPLADQPPKLAA